MAYQPDLPPACGGHEDERILLIEDSRMFSSVLSARFRDELGLKVTHCATLKALNEVLADGDQCFTMAVVDLNLPDAPYGEALDATIDHKIPPIVFTGSFDSEVRNRIMERNVVDYVLKDSEFALDSLVMAVRRAIANRKTKVLVVDDQTATRRILGGMLQNQQYTVYEARTGVEALEVLHRVPEIQLVLTDYHMPDMDGYELTRRIRNRYPSDQVRVIGISSSGDRLLSATFLKAGASDFVYRPFVAEELQCRIAHNVETLAQIKQLRTLAVSDYLTGLHNRRYFYDQGPRIVSACRRERRAATVAILDIDHFKQVNDSHGHEAGDAVLKAVATSLLRLFKGRDVLLSRLGGEEFAMLFQGMDAEAATAFCQDVRRSLTAPIIAEGRSLSVTVSIGVAEVSEHDTFDKGLSEADRLLYIAKNNGRNQVRCGVKAAASVR